MKCVDQLQDSAFNASVTAWHLCDWVFDDLKKDDEQRQKLGFRNLGVLQEQVWRILPRCWFNEATTEAGRGALGYYHEKCDDNRQIGLGPEHNWSSHAADAFGLMTIYYEEPEHSSRFNRDMSEHYRKERFLYG